MSKYMATEPSIFNLELSVFVLFHVANPLFNFEIYNNLVVNVNKINLIKTE